MKNPLIVLFSLFALAACQTTGAPPPNPAEIAARVCPPLEATLVVLDASPAISAGAREEIGRAAPIVHALCAPGGVASAANLAELADKTLPVIMQAVADSTLPDTEKQNILLSIALAQVALAAAR